MINRNKETFTVAEFAHLMGVSYGTVRYWLTKNWVPGAYEQGEKGITIRRWRIPRAALEMPRPRRGRPNEGGLIRKKDGVQLQEVKAELGTLKQQYMELMTKHASLQGKHDLLEAHNKTLQGSLEAERSNVEILKGKLDFQINRADAYAKMYQEMKSKLPNEPK